MATAIRESNWQEYTADYGDPSSVTLGSLYEVAYFDFSAIDFSGVTYDEVIAYIPPEYLTDDVRSALRKILGGDLSDVLAGQNFIRGLYEKYGPNVTLYDALKGDGYYSGGTSGDLPGYDLGGSVNISDKLFNLNEKFDFAKSAISNAIESPLYDLQQSGTWLAQNLGLPTTIEGMKGAAREELFDQIGATASEKLFDTIEDKLGRFGSGFRETVTMVQDTLAVKKIASEFIGNLMDTLEAGMNAVGKGGMTVEEYNERVDGNVGKFRDDAKAFLQEKHGAAGALVADILSGRAFGIQEVNSFKAMIYDEGAVITGGAKRDVIYGSRFADQIKLSAGGDVILAADGNDTIYFDPGYGGSQVSGGRGVDTMMFDTASNAYFYKRDAVGPHVTGPGGRMELDSVERLVFTNGTVATDTEVGENAGMAYRLYQAAFDRTPDNSGLKFWLTRFDAGENIVRIADGFLGSDEARKLYGDNPDAAGFVGKLYAHVLHRQGEAGGINYWVGQLASGVSRAQVLANFSESPENVTGVDKTIHDGIWLG